MTEKQITEQQELPGRRFVTKADIMARFGNPSDGIQDFAVMDGRSCVKILSVRFSWPEE